MSELQHQSSSIEYQIRINGRPVVYESMMSNSLIEEFIKICGDNPNDYVDIVHIRTEIIMSLQIYGIMEKHFKANNEK